MKFRLCLLLIVLAILFPQARPALATDAVVGNGTAQSCTEQEFDNALATVQAGGGTLTFDCGDAAGLLFTSQKIITANVVIQGADQITLSGGNSNRLFYVAAGAALTLQEITLTLGYVADDGGAIYNEGALTLLNAAVLNSRTDENHSGGAIASTGPLTITGSLLEGNSGANGGALFLRWGLGNAVITDSTLRENTTYDNSANGMGGAIMLWDGADVSLHNSILQDNHAQINGGAIHNQFANSSITLDGESVLSGNSAGSSGGGIYNNTGSVSLTNVTLSDNSVGDYGGGIYNNNGSATLTNATLNGNSAPLGGGILNLYGTTNLTNVTFINNSSILGNGGAINNNTNGTAILTNVTLSGNSARYGGGIINFGTATLTNVTLSNNSAENGGGIYRFSGTLTLMNVILDHSASSANCSGGIDYLSGIVSSGFNLSNDNSCGLNQVGDQNETAPLLGPLANYGGFTQTHLPLPGSPAIDTGTGLSAPATDQRGLPRPSGLATDKGAVERQPVELTLIYLPVVIK